MMQDTGLLWGGDLTPGPTGDLSLVSGDIWAQQRILRRLLTNPGDYIWNLTYGAGLAKYIGNPCNAAAIKSTIRSQIFLEAAVARTPEPSIDVQVIDNGSVLATIRYVDSTSGATQILSFSVNS